MFRLHPTDADLAYTMKAAAIEHETNVQPAFMGRYKTLKRYMQAHRSQTTTTKQCLDFNRASMRVQLREQVRADR